MSRRAACLVGALALLALVAPWLSPYGPGQTFADHLHAPPMRPHANGTGLPVFHPLTLIDRLDQRYEADTHRTVPLPWLHGAHDADPVFLLGADSYGRDVLSRLLHGARISVGLALVATLGALVLGTLAGAWAGYRGGWVDEGMMRVTDFILVLPVIYCVLVLRAALPLVLSTSTVFTLIAGIFVAVGWPTVARGVRAIVAAERNRDYVTAARSLGSGAPRLLTRHLLPACTGYLAVQAALLMPAFILAEATLSFVGLGFADPAASWGTMLSESTNVAAIVRFPWILTPAAAIFAVVLSANAIVLPRARTVETRLIGFRG